MEVGGGDLADAFARASATRSAAVMGWVIAGSLKYQLTLI
jgi:hypothetical protein